MFSSGHTCAARGKKAALVSLLGLLLAAGLPLSAHAATTPSSSAIPFSLGFNPASLSPVSGGVPVYTVGDTIWAESGYASAISLSLDSPSGIPEATVLVNPSVITPVYTFKANDADGIWNITLASGGRGVSVVPVRFVNLSDHQVSIGPISYSIDGGSLAISTSANLGDSYDQEVCAAGSGGVTLTLPTSMDETGNVTLLPSLSSLGLSLYGQVNESFSSWFELYQSYALDVTSANSLVVDNLLAAQSQPVAVNTTPLTNSTENVSSGLTWNAPIREGRYEMRAYFQNSTGSLDVVQLRVLVLNATTWISLGSTCLPETLQSQNLSYSASLTGTVATWPRTIYLMYRTFGVEAVEYYHIDANISSVNFVAAPWNQTVQDLKVNISPGSDVLSSGQAGSSVFVLSSSYPSQLGLSLEIGGGQGLQQQTVTLHKSYTSQTVNLNLAKLTVDVLGAQNSPSVLKVTGPGGLSITSDLTGANQTSSFLLPAGAYSVDATQGANTQGAQVSLTDGDASSVALNFSTFTTFATILILTATIAAVANVALWLFRSKGATPRLAKPSK